MTLIASGKVCVRNLDTGEEWWEIVEVFERDVPEMRDVVIEDVARDIAISQAEPAFVQTLECDLS